LAIIEDCRNFTIMKPMSGSLLGIFLGLAKNIVENVKRNALFGYIKV
jgi:hypothetical protein